ncbi:hypothetical protein IT568_01510 [bacterium]|nr:hypothetical protein [bacterium]
MFEESPEPQKVEEKIRNGFNTFIRAKNITGILFVCLGILLLIDNFFDNSPFEFGKVFAGALFVYLSVYFYQLYLKKQNHYILIPSYTFGGLGAGFLLTEFLFFIPETVIPIGIMFGIGTAFLQIAYSNLTKRWSMLIPGGTMFSIGLMIFVSESDCCETLAPSIFMFGLASTFGFVYFLSTINDKIKTDWAKYPAIVLFLIVAMILLTSISKLIFQIILALALISSGIYLIQKHFISQKNDEESF